MRPALSCRVVLLVLTAVLASCAGARKTRPVGPVAPREPLVDILDYEIAIDLDIEAGHVDGVVAVEFTALPGEPATRLVLDAAEMTVRSATDSQGRDLELQHRDHLLTVTLASPLDPGRSEIVTLDYEAYPRRGLYFRPPSARDPSRTWHVWSQGQSEENRFWVPCWDLNNERATHSLAVTLDADHMTMAAGELVSSVPHHRLGTRTDTWRMEVPHVSYLITLVAGDLGQGEVEGGEVPLPVVAEHDDVERARANLPETPAFLDILERFTGLDYPYVKYSQAFIRDYTAGGMENISATTMYYEGIHSLDDHPQLDVTGLYAHEAAHQWFGDLITCRDWRDLWINEGFADYCELVVMEELRGTDHVGQTLLSYRRTAVRAEDAFSRPIVWDAYTDPDQMFDGHAYQAAAMRLHLLRDTLGDEAFLRMVRHFVATRKEQVVTTEEAVATFQEVVDLDLEPFFRQWFHTPGYPRVATRVELDERLGEATPVLVMEQTQTGDGWPEVFELEVTVTWSRGGVEQEQRVTLDERVEHLALKGAPRTTLDWVRFDSDTVLPGVVTHDQSESSWVSQLRHATDGTTRLLAARWLNGDRSVRPEGRADDDLSPATVEALVHAARDDPSSFVRAEALAALVGTPPVEAVEAVARDLVEDDDPRVREAAIDLLGTREGDDIIPLLTTAVEDDNAYVVLTALRALADGGFPGTFRMAEELLATTDRPRLARDLLGLIWSLDDRRVLPLVLRTLATHPERWVRARAVRALGGYDRGGDHAATVYRRLCASLHDESYQVRAQAARALARFGDEAATIQLRARRDVEIDPSVLDALDQALEALD